MEPLSKKTSVISFRIDEKMKDMLDKESQIKHTTTNNLLNSIVRKHIKWDRFAEEIGIVFLSKPVLRKLLTTIGEKELTILAATICRGALKDAALFQTGKITPQTLLETIDVWLEHSHIPFRRFSSENNNEKYVVQHDLGKKYSLYLFTAISTLLSDVLCTTRKECLTEQTLDFEIVMSA